MINSFHKCQGAATLIITVILFVLSTLIILFAANYGILQSKAESNFTRYQQAYEAAEAGLEFGINYLKENRAMIIASPTGGYITPYSDSSTTDIALANNSKFTVVYTNPVANNYELIRITSTGTSDDGVSIRIIRQDVQQGSLAINPPTMPLVSKANISMGGAARVINLENDTTIQTASSVSISGTALTLLSSGPSSTALGIQDDVQQNDAFLAGQSEADFFSTYFGATSDQTRSQAEHYFNNSTNTNYSGSLNGLSGTSIWIDQTAATASISGATTIGSAANPVIMVINGNLNLSGNVVIYGLVYVYGTNTISTFSGNTEIYGSLITTDTLNMQGSIQVTYSSSILNNLQNQSATGYFAKVPGSWKDF